MYRSVLPYWDPMYPDYFKYNHPFPPFNDYPITNTRGFGINGGCIPDWNGGNPFSKGLSHQSMRPWNPPPYNPQGSLSSSRSLAPEDFNDMSINYNVSDDILLTQKLTRCADNLIAVDKMLSEDKDKYQEEALCNVYYCIGLLDSIGIISKDEIESSLSGVKKRSVEKGPCARLGERIDRDISGLLGSRGKGYGEKTGEYMDMVRECVLGGK